MDTTRNVRVAKDVTSRQDDDPNHRVIDEEDQEVQTDIDVAIDQVLGKGRHQIVSLK